MTESIHQTLAQHLAVLQVALEQAGIWQCEEPSEEALASQQPFCVDTMGFEQWLRYVFVHRFTLMVEHQLPLPSECAVAPMAEEAFNQLPLTASARTAVVEALNAIDQLVSTSKH